jgi:hypothetical protein
MKLTHRLVHRALVLAPLYWHNPAIQERADAAMDFKLQNDYPVPYLEVEGEPVCCGRL